MGIDVDHDFHADALVDLSQEVGRLGSNYAEIESLVRLAEQQHNHEASQKHHHELDHEVHGPIQLQSHHDDELASATAEVVGFTGGQTIAAATTFALGIPALSSLPTALATMYLDFDGHFEATWGDATTPPFDRDGNPSTLSSEELTFVEDVWRIVAEDYAPLNINVTTVEPAVLADGVQIGDANGKALRLAIGGTPAVLGRSDSIAGIARYNSFTNSAANIAYVFPESISGSYLSAVSAGMVSSHEAGHSFGLRHLNGAYDLTAQWQGIMNTSLLGFEDAYWLAATDDLGNFQDDMAMLASSLNGFGYRPDDVANTVASATPLAGSGTSFSGSGVIGAGNDVDVWSLTTTNTQSLRVSVAGSSVGQNLDAVLDFVDAAGNVILTSNPGDSNDAELFVEASGTIYVVVRGTGEYGRVGQYSISVSESTVGVTTAHPVRLNVSEAGLSDQFSVSLHR